MEGAGDWAKLCCVVTKVLWHDEYSLLLFLKASYNYFDIMVDIYFGIAVLGIL